MKKVFSIVSILLFTISFVHANANTFTQIYVDCFDQADANLASARSAYLNNTRSILSYEQENNLWNEFFDNCVAGGGSGFDQDAVELD